MADFTGVVVAGPPISEPANLERVGVVVPTPAQPSPTPLPLFRAQLAGEYVYFTGAPPVGATDIVIVSVPC